MAEEVEISNVGGENGVASEATLASLTRAIEKLAASTGRDPKKEAGKVQKAHNDAVKNGITIVTKNRDALEEKTKATKKATDAVNRYSKAIIGAIGGLLGSVTSSVLGLGKALFDGTDQLSDFAQHIPLVGGYLTAFTDILDDTFNTFRNLSSSGASFNNSMVDLMRASAEARMSIGDFGALVGRNSEKLASFGGTVTRGAQTIGRLQQGLGSMRTDLLNMGFTFEQINEGLIDYQFLNRAGSRAQIQSQQQLALSAGEYLMHLGELSKLTGKSVDQLQGELQERQNNAAFQMKLARMDPDQRARIQEALATALATGGKAGADRFMQMVLGMGPLTEETALLASTMPEVEAALRRLHDSAMNAATAQDFEASQVDAMVDMIAGAGAAGQRLETAIAAAGAGLGGSAAGIADILNGMGKSFADYQDQQGNIDKEALRRDIEAARAEQARRDALTRSMAAFNERITEARRSIQEQFINSGIYTRAANLVDKFSEVLSSPAMIDAIGSIIDVLSDFATNIQNFGLSTALFGGEVSGENRSVEIEGLFADLFGEGGIISGAFASVVPQLTTMFTDILGGAFGAIGEGISNWFSDNWFKILTGALVGVGVLLAAPFVGIGALIVAPVIAAFAGIATYFGLAQIEEWISDAWNSVTGVFSDIGDWWSGISFSNIFNDLWNRITSVFDFELPDVGSFLPDWMRSDETVEERELNANAANEFAGMATGGIATGPKSGYPMKLHGTEAVVPLPNGKSIPVDFQKNMFDNMRSTPTNEIPKIEIDNIAILSENIQDMKTELVKSINTTNQSSQETIKQLNKLMSQVLEVMQEMAEDSGNIERNTRSMGNNIANGRISAVR